MSVLSDRDLLRMYPDSPFVQPASVDLHIGSTLRYWPDWVCRDPRTDQSDVWRTVDLLCIGPGSAWRLKPGIRYLATTQERIKIQDIHAGEIGARSSWARDGLSVIQGPAGWLDPGYEGNPTLELSVVGSELILWPGARICQLILHGLTKPCLNLYSGKYQNDSVPQPSRSYQDVQP